MALTSLLQVGVLINPQRRRAALQELLEAVVEAVVLFIVSWSATLSMLQVRRLRATGAGTHMDASGSAGACRQGAAPVGPLAFFAL